MKKYLSLIFSAVMSLTAIASMPVSAESTDNNTIKSMTVIGDSIASGYGLDENEYSYAQICADYFNCNVDNLAVSGLDSAELCEMMQNMNETQKQSIRNSDVIVISIGGNDIINYSCRKIIEFMAERNLLKSGYTADDIPEEPNFTDIEKMVNMRGQGGFEEYIVKNPMAILQLNTELSNIYKSLCLNSDAIIPYKIMGNLNTILNIIREINPNTRIIVQTVYQPLQFSPEYAQKEFGTESYATMFSLLRSRYNSIMDNFRTQLKKVDGIEIADVFYQFTSLNDPVNDSTNDTPGCAYYFTDMQEPLEAHTVGGKTKDFHPNQKGHLAIATSIIDTLGIKTENSCELYAQIFNNLEDGKGYPKIAYNTFVKSTETKLGDLDGDGLVNASDATFVLAEYARLSTGVQGQFSEKQKLSVNTNRDRLVDAVDATSILQYYAHLSTGGTSEAVDFFY
ncbi:MAG: hypothetical protein K2H26_02060 [Ruminococcus sp.]|nr:hypothetical protein [Ruminococcus sp.]